MQAMLPPALEAMMRLEGRNMPNAMEMESLGMPIGVPFSNQAPYSPRGPMRDPRLSMLSTILSGLGAPMGGGPMAQPDPQTLFMRTSVSPGEPTIPVGHGGGFDEMEAMRGAGGMAPNPMDIQSAQASAAKTGQGMGIFNPQRHAAWKQGMADDEAGRRGLVNQRAMQVAQARTNRQSGMDPRTAALLAALGGEGELGGMMMADQVLGRGSGLKMREQDQTAEANRQAIAAKTGQATGPAATAGDVTAQGEAKVAGAIRSGDQAAIGAALAEEARALIAEANKRGVQPTDYAIGELHRKHGVSVQQAQEAVATATGSAQGTFKNRTGKKKPTDGTVIKDSSVNSAIGGWLNDNNLTDPLDRFYKGIGMNTDGTGGLYNLFKGIGILDD